MISTIQYLQFACAVSTFRSVVYIVAPTYVAKVKIDPDEWKKASIQEVAHAWIGTIRMWMITRAFVFGWGSTLSVPEERLLLVYASFACDIYIMYYLIRDFWLKKKGTIVHQNPATPCCIQFTLIIAGILAIK